MCLGILGDAYGCAGLHVESQWHLGVFGYKRQDQHDAKRHDQNDANNAIETMGSRDVQEYL